MNLVESNFGIKVDSRQGKIGLQDFNRSLGDSVKHVQGFAQKAKNSFESLKSQIFSVRGAMAALTGSFVLRQAFGAIREMETLGAVMRTVTDSAEQAEQAMAFVREFAKETPFQLAEVEKAFIQLVARGLDPSREAMMAFGDVAASMGRDITDFVRAVAQATVGEFESLKTFGISAARQGDQVTMRFKGQATTIGNNAKEINDYLVRLGQENFAGGMARQMDTIDGKISNLKDGVDNLFVSFGKLGMASGSKSSLDFLIEKVDEANGHVQMLRVYALSAIEGFETLRIKGGAAMAELAAQAQMVFSEDAERGIKNAAMGWLQTLAGTLDGGIDIVNAALEKGFGFPVMENTGAFDAIKAMREANLAGTETESKLNEIRANANGELRDMRENLDALRDKEMQAIAAQKELAAAFKSTGIVVEDTGTELSEYEKSLDKSSEAVRRMITQSDPSAVFSEQVHGLNELLSMHKITGDEFVEAWELFNANYENALDKNTEATDQYSKFAQRAAENIQDTFADFLFDPFSASLDDMLTNLGDTLRRMAAELISQQLLKSLFTSLSGVGGGWGAVFGMMAGTQHSGGVIGGGGGDRRVSPSAFVGAQRYHTGGIVGDEVPIIARRGEEVLTENDPRHSRNAGMSSLNLNFTVEAPNGFVEPESLAQIDAIVAQRLAMSRQRNG